MVSALDNEEMATLTGDAARSPELPSPRARLTDAVLKYAFGVDNLQPLVDRVAYAQIAIRQGANMARQTELTGTLARLAEATLVDHDLRTGLVPAHPRPNNRAGSFFRAAKTCTMTLVIRSAGIRIHEFVRLPPQTQSKRFFVTLMM